ncbi:MAG: efflux RND transporter periplasmic adaptor subunit [Pelolinea sp.]|nr:efflux RND transporter periplasmic adaptor subunit [Pelolinea sp.]
MKNKKVNWLVCVILILLASACSGLPINGNNNGDIKSSGRISALQVDVAPEVGGIVSVIDVEEGNMVMAGDVLFRIDDTLLKAQYKQAVAMVGVAESSVESANAQLALIELQLELTLQGVRQQERVTIKSVWEKNQPDDFDLPVWYFFDTENLTAIEQEVDAAAEALAFELENLNAVLGNSSSMDLVAIEERLAKAQAAYQIADQTLDQTQSADDRETLEDFAQGLFDEASAELDAAQTEYGRVLTTSAAQDVLDARSRVVVAQRHYDNSLDYLAQLQVGEQSLLVKVAKAAVTMAETGVGQAEANLRQAQAALEMIEIQLDKFIVKAPVDGIILSRNLDVGEMIIPGGVTIVIGQLEEVHLTVYVPEDKYGQIQLGQSVTITADSFPGESFDGQVIRISDEAEFTPRNVQTVEGRLATVYAVEILAPNPDLRLKPGMPADVVIIVH